MRERFRDFQNMDEAGRQNLRDRFHNLAPGGTPPRSP
jgi:hypothetical protein